MEVPDGGNAPVATLEDVVQLGDAPDIGGDPSARRQGLLAQVTRLLRAILVRHDDGKVDTCGGQPPKRSSLLRFIFVRPNGLPSELLGVLAGAEPGKRGRAVANLLACEKASASPSARSRTSRGVRSS